ncbi:hypothetical protein H5397_12730 [Propioniciclava sp. MC1683]|uniref:hypothetical protein n=1 Tax=Propioniciclava sp. MC1683 TaxID=2760309 RepID=UPI001603371F|nr:hypothetical protein [Propioniciclava sp. MC1683]MBB1502278.1 hypothetical protein [Propioniciclava sp. MC1683]
MSIYGPHEPERRTIERERREREQREAELRAATERTRAEADAARRASADLLAEVATNLATTLGAAIPAYLARQDATPHQEGEPTMTETEDEKVRTALRRMQAATGVKLENPPTPEHPQSNPQVANIARSMALDLGINLDTTN